MIVLLNIEPKEMGYHLILKTMMMMNFLFDCLLDFDAEQRKKIQLNLAQKISKKNH